MRGLARPRVHGRDGLWHGLLLSTNDVPGIRHDVMMCIVQKQKIYIYPPVPFFLPVRFTKHLLGTVVRFSGVLHPRGTDTLRSIDTIMSDFGKHRM